MAQGNFIVWLDLETTGLDPRTGIIIEIGMVITDYQLTQEYGSYHAIVQTEDADWEGVPAKVIEMHKSSGLGQRSYDSTTTLEQAEQGAIASMRQWFSSVKPPMGGRNPGFDRGFIQVHMPQLYGMFHHHLVDVCTLEEVIRMRKLEVPPFTPAWEHTAIADVRDSIEQTKLYLEHLGLVKS